MNDASEANSLSYSSLQSQLQAKFHIKEYNIVQTWGQIMVKQINLTRTHSNSLFIYLTSCQLIIQDA